MCATAVESMATNVAAMAQRVLHPKKQKAVKADTTDASEDGDEEVDGATTSFDWETLKQMAGELECVKGSCNPYRHSTDKQTKYVKNAFPVAKATNG